jgi:hypothetical protein
MKSKLTAVIQMNTDDFPLQSPITPLIQAASLIPRIRLHLSVHCKVQ